MKATADSIFFEARRPTPADETAFFARLKMRNGTFKLTRPSRFEDWEAVLRPFVEARAGSLRQVLDIGASTGITTVELAAYLRCVGLSPRMTATDLFIDAYLVTAAPGLRVLCDRDGWPLLYDIAGVPLRPWTRRLDYLTLAFAPLALARRILQPRLLAAIGAGRASAVQMTTRVPGGEAIRFVQNDIMAPTPEFTARFDFVRAANILNTGYFPPAKIRLALDNIRAYLAGSGSLFLVTRTGQGEGNRGTLFELDASGRFRVVARVGGGSEIEAHVAALEPAPRDPSERGTTKRLAG